jgi:hypothetical protein
MVMTFEGLKRASGCKSHNRAVRLSNPVNTCVSTASIVAGACGLAALFFLTRERISQRQS